MLRIRGENADSFFLWKDNPVKGGMENVYFLCFMVGNHFRTMNYEEVNLLISLALFRSQVQDQVYMPGQSVQYYRYASHPVERTILQLR